MYEIINKTEKTLSLDEGITVNGGKTIELETLPARVVYLERNGFLITNELSKKANKNSSKKENKEVPVEEELQELSEE